MAVGESLEDLAGKGAERSKTIATDAVIARCADIEKEIRASANERQERVLSDAAIVRGQDHRAGRIAQGKARVAAGEGPGFEKAEKELISDASEEKDLDPVVIACGLKLAGEGGKRRAVHVIKNRLRRNITWDICHGVLLGAEAHTTLFPGPSRDCRADVAVKLLIQSR